MGNAAEMAHFARFIRVGLQRNIMASFAVIGDF
jgi:hypothetical protein